MPQQASVFLKSSQSHECHQSLNMEWQVSFCPPKDLNEDACRSTSHTSLNGRQLKRRSAGGGTKAGSSHPGTLPSVEPINTRSHGNVHFLNRMGSKKPCSKATLSRISFISSNQPVWFSQDIPGLSSENPSVLGRPARWVTPQLRKVKTTNKQTAQ